MARAFAFQLRALGDDVETGRLVRRLADIAVGKPERLYSSFARPSAAAALSAAR